MKTIFDLLVANPEQEAANLARLVNKLGDTTRGIAAKAGYQLNKLLEAQRIEQRTKYDLEMLSELGICSGIENYSRYFDGRKPGEAPFTLLDFFPKEFSIYILFNF